MTRIIATALLLAGTLVLSCQTTTSGPWSEDQGNTKPSASPSPESTPTSGAPAQPTVGLSQEETRAADLARRQLASDKSIPTDQIQVITPGYKVTLSAQGTTYEYHTAGTQRAALCKK